MKNSKQVNLQTIRLEKYRELFSKVDAVMIAKLTTKYSNDICDTLMNQWESDCKREKDKSKAIFERKKGWYQNNATTEFRNKDRDESNPEEKGKHGKFITKFPNNGELARGNRGRSRSEDRNENTKSGNQCTPPIYQTENRTGKKSPTLDQQRNYPKYLFKRRQRFRFPLQRYQKQNRTKFQVAEHSMLKQRPRNNQTVIAGEEHYYTMIVPETQDSQIPTNNEQENGETNDSFLF